jgi:hypothetical protein
MSRARDNADLGDSYGSLAVGVTGGSGLNALSASNLSAGTVPDARMPNLTGDITTVEGAVATTIADDAVTGAKIENNPTIAGNLTVTGDIVPSTPLSNRNLVINGGMQVWQRATAATAAPAMTADRWKLEDSNEGTFTSEKHTMTLAELNTTGHATAIKLLVTGTDTSIASANYADIHQKIEGQNLQHLQYGTASAKTLTLSFWVKSNLTGTYTICIRKTDSTAAYFIKEYTIDVGDTWEQKTITIPTAVAVTGAGGVIANDNGEGFMVLFGLMWGDDHHGTDNTWSTTQDFSTSNQVNWMGASNNFYLTGVQLELGSNATPFEHRSYGDELARCQRYFVDLGDRGQYTQYSSAYRVLKTSFPVVMRTTPTVETRTSGATSVGTNIDPYFYEEYHAQAYNANTSWHMTALKMTAEL